MGPGIISVSYSETPIGVPVPYLASAHWYGVYIRALTEGKKEMAARRAANQELGLHTRDFRRSLIAPGMLLSVPMEGSSSSKNSPPENLLISGHGNWIRTHLGALDATLRRTPFFEHMMPGIKDVYSKKAQPGMSLAALSEALHHKVCEVMNITDVLNELPRLSEMKRRILAASAAELRPSIAADEAMLSGVMRLGPDAILPFLTAL